jgi:glycosyltransferase involved in cell wall biosynthesis
MNLYPKVSVIIPFYNAENFLEISINSVINQTWKNIEIILIDDGSTDGSHTIALAFSKIDDRLQLFKIPNSGQCSATNYAINRAIGDFIQFLDADDYLDFEKIQNQIQFYIANELTCKDLLFGAFSDVGSESNMKPHYKAKSPVELVLANFNYYMVANSSFLISKELIFEAGGYEEDLTLDNNYEYFTKLILKSNNVFFVNESKVYCRYVPTSLSRRKDQKSLESAFRARKLACERFFNYCERTDKIDKSVAVCLLQIILLHPNISNLFINDVFEFYKKNKIRVNIIDLIPRGKFRLIVHLLGLKTAIKLKKIIYFK